MDCDIKDTVAQNLCGRCGKFIGPVAKDYAGDPRWPRYCFACRRIIVEDFRRHDKARAARNA